MNFKTFLVDSTNIFPIANDTKGGQLMSEWNLRTRESVATPQNVKYLIGPSYTHSMEDFEVRCLSDAGGAQISSSVLELLPGRALVNGHFIENLLPMTIDLIAANASAQENHELPLNGKLCVGLKVYYSTESTMSGAMETVTSESEDLSYEGIQVVILPESEFKLPTDVPNDPTLITAHLKLATFNYINGTISGIKNNPAKVSVLSASRISNFDGLIDSKYVTKTGLNPKKLYVFSGKGSDELSGYDTWCEAQDSLIVWDNNPTLTTNNARFESSAIFKSDLADDSVKLILPHKQVDGMVDTEGRHQYYQQKILTLPKADYATSAPGTVTSEYTRNIKEISQKINNLYNLPAGKQRGYIPIRHTDDPMPPLNSKWNVGDYILVGQDYTVDSSDDTVGAPSTIYVVLPGYVEKIEYYNWDDSYRGILDFLEGIQLNEIVYELDQNIRPGQGDEIPNDVIPNIENSEIYNTYWNFSENAWRGTPDTDYFTYTLQNIHYYRHYYYKVAVASSKTYSSPVLITGSIPLAQENVVGGFYNVPETALDGGYVIRDDAGHLRLLDYGLLRLGTLAYQLGTDFTVPAGLNNQGIQEQLDEYVNERIAFPNRQHVATSNPNVINLTLTLAAEDQLSEINIYNLDSRFNTAVYLHILGDATDTTTINIRNCEKIRIDSHVGGNPVINLYRSSLYYDASILDRLNIISDMSLWYEKFSDDDPSLIVDNMTVRSVDAPVIADDMNPWNLEVPNDNHFAYALQSITFSSTGDIIGCGLYIKNETTTNIETGKYIITAQFNIPHGVNLDYPQSRLTKQLKVTGSFITAYPIQEPAGYMVINTDFTAVSQAIDPYTVTQTASGVIAFYITADTVENVVGLPAGTPIDGWDSNQYHVFTGTFSGSAIG